MEFAWKVVGWEACSRKNDPEKFNIRLHCQQPLPDGGSGEGLACKVMYFNPEYVNYSPVIGQMIVATEGRFGIDRIIVVG